DLNHAADGGLYAEMIQNRSFEFCSIDHPTYHALTGWQKADGSPLKEEALALRVLQDDPIHPNNPHYLKVNTNEEIAIYNDRCNRCLYSKEVDSYLPSFFAKAHFNPQKVRIAFINASKIVLPEEISIDNKEWQKYELEVHLPETIHK